MATKMLYLAEEVLKLWGGSDPTAVWSTGRADPEVLHQVALGSDLHPEKHQMGAETAGGRRESPRRVEIT